MTEISLLAGKVLKRTIPKIPAPSGPEAPFCKRLLLTQGELAQFYDGDRAVHYMAVIELIPGKLRGNHYHDRKEEVIYMIAGKTELLVEDVKTGERRSLVLEAGDLTEIRTQVAHALRPLEQGCAIEFSQVRFDPADIQRYTLA